MNRKDFAALAAKECAELSVRPGRIGSAPFWNIEATQFMYAPSFAFAGLVGINNYRFDAVDESGKTHSFKSERADSLLTPVWAELPEGVITLTVTALKPDGTDYLPVGTRTFFKLASFPEETPKATCPYRDCVKKAFEYTMQQSFVRHWLEFGTPDPCYDLNTYPSKIISSLVEAMISFGKMYPEGKSDAMKVAVTAADWLMSITRRGDHVLANIPPTYYFDFCPDPEKCGIITPNWNAAQKYKGTVMMIYPASAGKMYVELARATGEKKYIEEAEKIGKFYLDTVLENGSWYLVRDEETGEPVANNFVAPMENVIPFLTALYSYTQAPVWKELCEKAVAYTEKHQLAGYNWEGQFEDTGTSAQYNNLSQYGPVGLARYYLAFHGDDPQKVETAKELMRFVEDQFVVWNRPSPWRVPFTYNDVYEDGSKWTTPACLEQYRCYFPIDASAAHVVQGFMALYEAGCGDIYLAKSRVLCDQMTRVQHENGQIPTFWMHTPSAESNFWFNCMFATCQRLEEVSRYDDIKFE